MALPAARRHSEPAAWRVNAWLDEVPISRSKFYQEKNGGWIETVKSGSSTLVLTPPKAYLAALRERAVSRETPAGRTT